MAKTALAAPDPAEARRVVVLTKPGDLLLVGNASALTHHREHLDQVAEVFKTLGITVAFFVDDIDIAKLSADG